MELRELNLIILAHLHHVAKSDIEKAVLVFGVTHEEARAVAQTSLQRLQCMASRTLIMWRPREGLRELLICDDEDRTTDTCSIMRAVCHVFGENSEDSPVFRSE